MSPIVGVIVFLADYRKYKERACKKKKRKDIPTLFLPSPLFLFNFWPHFNDYIISLKKEKFTLMLNFFLSILIYPTYQATFPIPFPYSDILR